MSNVVRIVHSHDAHEFFIFADPDELERYQKDKSVPLVNVVESFQVHTVPNGGVTGEAVQPSNGELMSAFGTTDETEIVKKILDTGEVKGVHGSLGKAGAIGKGGNKNEPIF